MTSGSGCPRNSAGEAVRHAVSQYKGVPLLEPRSGPELLAHLNAGCRAAATAAARPVPTADLPL
eukprot:19036-Prymnesium_polylepis.1